MKLEVNSIEEYINLISDERREYFEELRNIINKNIPKGFVEELSYGMPGWVVPKSIYPKGYHCDRNLPLPFINLANQKNFIALYHLGLYADRDIYNWFIDEYKKRCKYKLDMGESCIRFKKIDSIPFDLIAQLCRKIDVNRWIELYESSRTSKKQQ